MKICTKIVGGAALAANLLVASIAYADSFGATGTVVGVTVNEPSADGFGVERGHIVISEGGTHRKYMWGGTACSGRYVAEATIALMAEAMHLGTAVTPTYKVGTGQVRCLVGIRLGV